MSEVGLRSLESAALNNSEDILCKRMKADISDTSSDDLSR